MYEMFIYIWMWVFFGANVGNYSIHGAYGYRIFGHSKHQRLEQAAAASKCREPDLFGDHHQQLGARKTRSFGPLKIGKIYDPQS